MIWVNINIILMLLGNELNLAIKKVRIEKLMSDEIAKDYQEMKVLQAKEINA